MIPGNHLEDNSYMTPKKDEVVSVKTPRLEPLDRLYVRAYLSSLSHIEAHRVVAPTLKTHHSDNIFSRKESVQFHISSALQDKADSLMISPELIIEKLYKEATREGAGSNHAARIQALTQLGKHFGLFQEKKESTSHTFNIVNYSSTPIVPQDLIVQVEPNTSPTQIDYDDEYQEGAVLQDKLELVDIVEISNYN